MTIRNLPNRDEFVRGLRELADWLEAHPQVPVTEPGSAVAVAQIGDYNSDDPRGDIAQVARAMDRAEKHYREEGYFELKRHFSGGVYFEAWTTRDVVCERIVVGTEEVEVPDPAAPKVRQTVEKVEWRCSDALLADGPKAVAS